MPRSVYRPGTLSRANDHHEGGRRNAGLSQIHEQASIDKSHGRRCSDGLICRGGSGCGRRRSMQSRPRALDCWSARPVGIMAGRQPTSLGRACGGLSHIERSLPAWGTRSLLPQGPSGRPAANFRTPAAAQPRELVPRSSCGATAEADASAVPSRDKGDKGIR